MVIMVGGRNRAVVSAKVIAPTEDGKWIRVKYLESFSLPRLVGQEDLVYWDEVWGREAGGAS